MGSGVLIIAESAGSELKKSAFELAGVGGKLAESLGGPISAALVGAGVSGLAADLGATDRAAGPQARIRRIVAAVHGDAIGHDHVLIVAPLVPRQAARRGGHAHHFGLSRLSRPPNGEVDGGHGIVGSASVAVASARPHVDAAAGLVHQPVAVVVLAVADLRAGGG